MPGSAAFEDSRESSAMSRDRSGSRRSGPLIVAPHSCRSTAPRSRWQSPILESICGECVASMEVPALVTWNVTTTTRIAGDSEANLKPRVTPEERPFRAPAMLECHPSREEALAGLDAHDDVGVEECAPHRPVGGERDVVDR